MVHGIPAYVRVALHECISVEFLVHLDMNGEAELDVNCLCKHVGHKASHHLGRLPFSEKSCLWSDSSCEREWRNVRDYFSRGVGPNRA